MLKISAIRGHLSVWEICERCNNLEHLEFFKTSKWSWLYISPGSGLAHQCHIQCKSLAMSVEGEVITFRVFLKYLSYGWFLFWRIVFYQVSRMSLMRLLLQLCRLHCHLNSCQANPVSNVSVLIVGVIVSLMVYFQYNCLEVLLFTLSVAYTPWAIKTCNFFGFWLFLILQFSRIHLRCPIHFLCSSRNFFMCCFRIFFISPSNTTLPSLSFKHFMPTICFVSLDSCFAILKHFFYLLRFLSFLQILVAQFPELLNIVSVPFTFLQCKKAYLLSTLTIQIMSIKIKLMSALHYL